MSETQAVCGFNLAWIGMCRQSVENEGDRCPEHTGIKCCSCGKPASRQCPHTGIQFVCGSPLCNDCEHGTPEPGNGGFFMLGGGHHPKAVVR